MNEARLLYEMAIRKVSRKDICSMLGMSRTAFYRKCKGKTEFTRAEIQKIVDYLELDTPVGIFFDIKVS